jgi:hypothetical protein
MEALKGGSSKHVGFQPTKPGNFDGARDWKVVDAWLAEMKDYIHAAKVGRHSAVELAQSYLKGYAATWWMSQPHFGQVWGWSPTLPKLGTWSPPGLPNV